MVCRIPNFVMTAGIFQGLTFGWWTGSPLTPYFTRETNPFERSCWLMTKRSPISNTTSPDRVIWTKPNAGFSKYNHPAADAISGRLDEMLSAQNIWWSDSCIANGFSQARSNRFMRMSSLIQRARLIGLSVPTGAKQRMAPLGQQCSWRVTTSEYHKSVIFCGKARLW